MGTRIETHSHLNPERKFEVGVLVRWKEFPDRLYYITETGIRHCGQDCYRIETVDHKWLGIVGEDDLVWDDVDYVEYTEVDDAQLKEYLRVEFTHSTIPKYYKYFEEWFANLTEDQKRHYSAYYLGKKTPYDYEPE